MSDIFFKKVCKGFQEEQVISDLSLVLKQNQTYYVMGPSGAGKTTFINLLMGLIAPDSGTIEGAETENFSCVFQEDRLIEQEDAITNLQMIFNRKIPIEAIEAELCEVGLEEDMYKPVSKLSGGMKRRVAIVRAMMADSDTVILDEPFKGLDEELKERIMDYVEDHIGARRLILITHTESEGIRLCNEKILLNSI